MHTRASPVRSSTVADPGPKELASRNRTLHSQAGTMPAMSKDSRRAQRTVLAAGAAAAVVAGSTGSTFVAGPVARTLPTASTVQQPAHIVAGASAAPQSGSSAVLSAGGFALAASAAAVRSSRKSKKVATKATAVSTEAIQQKSDQRRARQALQCLICEKLRMRGQ